MFTLQFLGATGTVTGSKFFLSDGETNILIDCGLYQGLKELRLRNWTKLPVDPGILNYCILTHAHIDHSGYLPCLPRDGFKGQILATSTTVDLAHIMLPDSAHLQEEEARYANKKGTSKHKPALPLYNTEDAMNVLEYLKPVDYNREIKLSPHISFKLLDAGHLLGSAIVEFILRWDDKVRRLVITGDLGRYNAPILKNPSNIYKTDYLVLESTYGDRMHSSASLRDELKKVISTTFSRGGCVIIPSFTIGRVQEVLYYIRELQEANELSPETNIYIDSPMAIDATKIFLDHPEDHNIASQRLALEGISPIKCHNLNYSRTVEESKSLNELKYGQIIISADGMVTGGRILHHMINRLPDERNTILFVGYQAIGTRGRAILEGAESVKIFGEKIPIKAKIAYIDGFSAHADYLEILYWLKNFEEPPVKTFLVHGEPEALVSLKDKITSNFRNWDVVIPEYKNEFILE